MLHKLGFPAEMEVGQAVLPSHTLGPISRRNAQGWDIVHRDRPKEQAFRQYEWCWEQFCGRDQTETVCRVVEVPYWRYPRTSVPPPSIELFLSNDNDGNMIALAPTFRIGTDEEATLKHTINLFLELFGECHVFYADLSALVFSRSVKLNWTVLPQGKQLWINLLPSLEPILNIAKPRNRIVIRSRVEFINRYEPTFVAVGRAGFSGYLVFGFPERHLFFLESIYTNNATYVLGESWEQISQLSKAEILNDRLHRYRFVHRADWESKVAELLLPASDHDVFEALAA